jgi:hypothetical protein
MPELIRFSEDSNHLVQLPGLARRLGVAPLDKDKMGYLVLVTKDGARYDLFELLNAFLDKLDAIA